MFKQYTGSKTKCDYCESGFFKGEYITVSDNMGLIFCYSDASGGCLMNYVFKNAVAAYGDTQTYEGEETLNSPVDALLIAPPPKKSWLQLLKDLFKDA